MLFLWKVLFTKHMAKVIVWGLGGGSGKRELFQGKSIFSTALTWRIRALSQCMKMKLSSQCSDIRFPVSFARRERSKGKQAAERREPCSASSVRHLPQLQIHVKQSWKTSTQLALACLHMGAFNERHTLFITCLHFKPLKISWRLFLSKHM